MDLETVVNVFLIVFAVLGVAAAITLIMEVFVDRHYRSAGPGRTKPTA